MHTVFLVAAGGKRGELEAVQVKTGITDGIYTELLAGLKEGDTVVTGLNYSTASMPGGRSFGGFPRFR